MSQKTIDLEELAARLASKQPKSRAFSLRLTEDVAVKIEALALKHGVSMNQLVAVAVEEVFSSSVDEESF